MTVLRSADQLSERRPGMAKHYRAPRMRRYIPRRTKWAIGLTAVAVILVGLLVAGFLKGWIKVPQWPWEQEPEVTVPTEPKPDTVIHLVAGGDVKVTGLGTVDDHLAALTDILPVLSGADLTALNFEGNVYADATDRTSSPQLLDALRQGGVDVLQTANSESITNGLLGLMATNNAIRNAGMQPLGTYATEAEYEQYRGYLIYEIQGIRIALVAFTKGMDDRNLEGNEHCVNLLYTDYTSTYKEVDKTGITEVIRAAQEEEPDLIVAMLHWGGRTSDQVSGTQKQIVKLMKNLGVDAVIGTHSRHVQKMGFEDRDGMFVAYSLGDFMVDRENVTTGYSVLLDLEITRDGATGQVRITGYDYVPVYQYYREDGTLELLRIREA
ncbi:MAG: CapA family protein, partial [Ruminococcaceae bacterium]|nr:CapA family protein [Oscillospiraceae bacterium]